MVPLEEIDLSGFRVLVTRPDEVADGLCEMIEVAGGSAIKCPAMEIVAAEPNVSTRNALNRLGTYDIVIFISRNAVNFGLALEEFRLSKPAITVAIGAGTAAALRERGIEPAWWAREGGSEALVAHPGWSQLVGQRILIVRGVGGRELLAESLTERGFQVDYAEVYTRQIPTSGRDRLREIVHAGWVDLAIATSTGSIENLCRLAAPELTARLQRTPLAVLSKRIRDYAYGRGWSSIEIAGETSDLGLVGALATLAKDRHALT